MKRSHLFLAWLMAASWLPLPVKAAQDDREARIAGSSSMFAMMARAAEVFGAITAYPAPVVEHTGTGGGFKAFCHDLTGQGPDIIAASRPMTAEERRDCNENGNTELSSFALGRGAIVFVQSRTTSPLPLTSQDLWLALARLVPHEGRLTANPYKLWSDINPALPDRPIRVYGPPPTSGTRDGLVEHLLRPLCVASTAGMDLPESERWTQCGSLREDEAFIQAGENDEMLVNRVSAAPEAIGIVAFNAAESAATELALLSLDGIEPTFETLADGRYPLARDLSIYVNRAHGASVPSLAPLVTFLSSEAVIGPDGYLEEIGLIPLAEQDREASRSISRRVAADKQP